MADEGGKDSPIAASELVTDVEDEFVKSVDRVAMFGVFGGGAILRGVNLESLPTYQKAEPDGWWPETAAGRFSNYTAGLVFPDSGRSGVHLLTIIDETKEEGFSTVTLTYDQRYNAGGRGARYAQLFFRMPTERAESFVRIVKEREDGADLVERFVQKAASGIIANSSSAPGIRREKVNELLVFDKMDIANIFGQDVVNNPNSFNYSDGEGYRRYDNFSRNFRQLGTLKPYFSPVGVN